MDRLLAMRSAVVFVASLLVISGAGGVKARERPAPVGTSPEGAQLLSAPDGGTRGPAQVPLVVTPPPVPLSSTLTTTNGPDFPSFQDVDTTVVAAHAASIPTPDVAALVLRGVTLVEDGYGRAYIEDSSTGKVTGYALGDTVGDSRIEEIQADHVVLRHGDEIIHLLLGVESTMSSPTPEADATSLPLSPGQSPGISSVPGDRQIIGNGQAWLDTLGIPPGVLSRAIESALPAQHSNDLDD